MRNLTKSKAFKECGLNVVPVKFKSNGRVNSIGFDVLCDERTGLFNRDYKKYIAATFEPVYEREFGKVVPRVKVSNKIGSWFVCWIEPNDMASMLRDFANAIEANKKYHNQPTN